METSLANDLSEKYSGIPDRGRFSLDGSVPNVVIAPSDATAAARALAEIARAEAVCVPWGGGTQQSLGFIPAPYDLAISTANLTRVVDLQPGDLTVTVQAGMTLASVQELLGKHGQFVALESAHPDLETIGGILATGASALLRYAYGGPRDQVIGITAAMPDGTVVRGGGRVVKNVAGYDLCKLFTGSMGTLGLLVEATFRVRPLPSVSRTWVAAFGSASDVETAVSEIVDSPMLPSFIQCADPGACSSLAPFLPAGLPDDCWMLALGCDGVEALSLWTCDEATRVSGSKWTRALEGAESASLRGALIEGPFGASKVRVSVRGSQLMEFMEGARSLILSEAGSTVAAIAAAGNGVAYLSFDAAGNDPAAHLAVLDRLADMAVELEGTLAVLRCPAEVRSTAPMWGRARPTQGLMKRIRRAFDPGLNLNRGRLFRGEEV